MKFYEGEEANAQRELAMTMSNRGYIKSASSQELSVGRQTETGEQI